MRLTIKEKAGILDVSRIYEGLHLSDGFIERFATNHDSIDEPELIESANKHFGICEKCRNKKAGYLPLSPAEN